MNDKSHPFVRVSAALIRSEGRFLICRRPPGKARALLWEFVGGKLEPGETGEQALVRECREELGVTVQPGSVFASLVHDYPDLTVELTIYNAEIVSGKPQLLEHCDMRWITADEIPQFDFCPADMEILNMIKMSGARLNCTPFVRQCGILSNKWGGLLCRREYQTRNTHQNSRSWWWKLC